MLACTMEGSGRKRMGIRMARGEWSFCRVDWAETPMIGEQEGRAGKIRD